MSRYQAPGGHRGIRVIAGSARGRRLKVPPGKAVRPTRDRVREALFSILGNSVPGSFVLDAFAGSGALGIEALSRGAGRAVFCDERTECVRVIEHNLTKCGFARRALVFHARLPDGLPTLRDALEEPFDLVFLDPPYREGEKGGILESLGRFALLKEGARIVFERPREEVFPSVPKGFVVVEERRYGNTLLTFLNYHPGEPRHDGR